MDELEPLTPNQKKWMLEDEWPLTPEAARKALQKGRKRLERYRAALRLVGVDIERRNRNILALTTFTYQAGRIADPTALLKLALVHALETIGAPVGAILLIDAETKELILGVQRGLSPRLNRILTGQELASGASTLMPHLVSGNGALLEYETADEEEEQMLLAVGHLTSLVSLPLKLGPRLMGALLVGLQGQVAFTSAELRFLLAVSQATAIALDSLNLREGIWNIAETLLGSEKGKARLQNLADMHLALDEFTPPMPFELPPLSPTPPQPDQADLDHLLAAMLEAEDEVEQQNEDLQALNELSKQLNHTLDQEVIVRCAVEQARGLFKADAAWLYLVTSGGQGLSLRAHSGLSEVYVRGMQRLQLNRGLEGQVAASRQACFVEAISTDGGSYKIWVDKEGLQALGAVPLLGPELEPGQEQPDSRLIGVLAVGMRTVHSWSARQVRLLNSIANQVALAINNARLYAQVQENEFSMRTGNEVLQTINDMLLKKNAFVEDFIHDELTLALAGAGELLQQLLADTASAPGKQQYLLALQKIISKLQEISQEVGYRSASLNAKFEQARQAGSRPLEYTDPIKPIRLKDKLEQ